MSRGSAPVATTSHLTAHNKVHLGGVGTPRNPSICYLTYTNRTPDTHSLNPHSTKAYSAPSDYSLLTSLSRQTTKSLPTTRTATGLGPRFPCTVTGYQVSGNPSAVLLEPSALGKLATFQHKPFGKHVPSVKQASGFARSLKDGEPRIHSYLYLAFHKQLKGLQSTKSLMPGEQRQRHFVCPFVHALSCVHSLLYCEIVFDAFPGILATNQDQPRFS